MDSLAAAVVMPQRPPNPGLVRNSDEIISDKVGIRVPRGTGAPIAARHGVGTGVCVSLEELRPLVAWYEVEDWREGGEHWIQLLRYGRMGHTIAIHSQNDDVRLQFGLKKPAFRICVNTPTTHGSIGLTTGLDPAMTLGC